MLAAGLATVLSISCGTLAPPVSVDSTSRTSTDNNKKLSVEAVEGRPQGLLLRLRSNRPLASGGKLEVHRRVGDRKPTVIRTIELSDEFTGRLRQGNLQFLDRAVVADKPLDYRLLYTPPEAHGGTPEGRRHQSRVLTLSWNEPPPTPDSVDVTMTGSRAVELRWKPRTSGVLIFRRNVLKEGAKTRRIARLGPAAHGVFVDRDIRPQGVYAYRIALAIERETFVQFGPPSEPVYVSVDGNSQHN